MADLAHLSHTERVHVACICQHQHVAQSTRHLLDRLLHLHLPRRLPGRDFADPPFGVQTLAKAPQVQRPTLGHRSRGGGPAVEGDDPLPPKRLFLEEGGAEAIKSVAVPTWPCWPLPKVMRPPASLVQCSGARRR